MDQLDKAERFRALHVAGRPFVLFNVWDPGSAKVVAKAGAAAIATGSWSVARANGFDDGENIPLALAMDILARIVAATTLPVSVDIESGYGNDPEAVYRTVERTIEAGAVGCNLEDSFPGSGELRGSQEQVHRIAAARKASKAASGYFINARTDVFFQKPAQMHDVAMIEEALARARAYADAGADGLFAPGLMDEALIAKLAKASPLPLNVMVGESTPTLRKLSDAGVARISHGPGPYIAAMRALEDAARAATARG
ncbi:MAG TPA: isocitrate lyase/phosphoenolpyruvate mutase family protein [Steroidobacteraceae bacterium]|jgi:methylisocitrate lyase|nr:isocitrate lyase/phosphoenolpyruvate mutase family protein [Steroidobacteraceae bacterium]